MENKHNFMGIIIPVIVAVILLTVIPILTNMSTDCSHNIGQLNINPDFSSGDYFVDKGSYDYIDSATIIKDENLIPENIKKDVTIFGITGTLESGGGASLDRIGMISFSIDVSKYNTTSQTLTYQITSGMLNKTFFTDGEGNWYLPEDVSVYYQNTYKGKANTALTLYSGSGTTSGRITFSVGTTPVALLLYFYQDEPAYSGIFTEGYLKIKWSGTADIDPSASDMEFIELSDNFFDDFPYYSDPDVDYWRKINFFAYKTYIREINIGWEIFDPD